MKVADVHPFSALCTTTAQSATKVVYSLYELVQRASEQFFLAVTHRSPMPYRHGNSCFSPPLQNYRQMSCSPPLPLPPPLQSTPSPCSLHSIATRLHLTILHKSSCLTPLTLRRRSLKTSAYRRKQPDDVLDAVHGASSVGNSLY